MATSWKEFKEIAREIAQEEGYPLGVLLGQAAEETAYGQSRRAQEDNNWFGIGVYNDNSRGINSRTPEESIREYIKLITTSPYYAKAWAQYQQDQDPIALIDNVAPTYAANPNYARNVKGIKEFRNEHGDAPEVLGAATGSRLGVPDKLGKFETELRRSIEEEKRKATITPSPTSVLNDPKKAEMMRKIKEEQKQPMWERFARQIFDPLIPDAGASEINASQMKNSSAVGQPQQANYQVAQGDTLWGIAQRQLGDGNRWQELGYQGEPTQMPIGTQIPMMSRIPSPRVAIAQKNPTASQIASTLSRRSTPANANATSAATGEAIDTNQRPTYTPRKPYVPPKPAPKPTPAQPAKKPVIYQHGPSSRSSW